MDIELHAQQPLLVVSKHIQFQILEVSNSRVLSGFLISFEVVVGGFDGSETIFVLSKSIPDSRRKGHGLPMAMIQHDKFRFLRPATWKTH